MKMHRTGFTLIELMITVAIVGILAAIGVAAYQNYIESAKRTEAQTVLVDIASKEESYINAWGNYLDVGAWNPSTMPGNGNASLPWATGTGYENWEILGFALSGPSRWSYAVKATNTEYTVGACRRDGARVVSLYLTSVNRRVIMESNATIVTGFACPNG